MEQCRTQNQSLLFAFLSGIFALITVSWPRLDLTKVLTTGWASVLRLRLWQRGSFNHNGIAWFISKSTKVTARTQTIADSACFPDKHKYQVWNSCCPGDTLSPEDPPHGARGFLLLHKQKLRRFPGIRSHQEQKFFVHKGLNSFYCSRSKHILLQGHLKACGFTHVFVAFSNVFSCHISVVECSLLDSTAGVKHLEAKFPLCSRRFQEQSYSPSSAVLLPVSSRKMFQVVVT